MYFSKQSYSARMSSDSRHMQCSECPALSLTVLHGNDAQIEGNTLKVPVTLHRHKWRVSVVWFGGDKVEDGEREVGRMKNLL